eukprot:10356212-Karenia_brevis.AAC.1
MDLQSSHSLAPRQIMGGTNTADELGVNSSPKTLSVLHGHSSCTAACSPSSWAGPGLPGLA